MKSNLPTINELEDLLGSKELVLFFLTWLENNRNATKTYQELHPNVTDHSARILGSRVLAKVDIKVIALAYGLDTQKYFEVLKGAIDAEKWNDFTGEREKDYKTIKPYHDKLGKLLGIETDQPQTQVNIANIIQKQKDDYDI
jgi:hypothetical protein